MQAHHRHDSCGTGANLRHTSHDNGGTSTSPCLTSPGCGAAAGFVDVGTNFVGGAGNVMCSSGSDTDSEEKRDVGGAGPGWAGTMAPEAQLYGPSGHALPHGRKGSPSDGSAHGDGGSQVTGRSQLCSQHLVRGGSASDDGTPQHGVPRQMAPNAFGGSTPHHGARQQPASPECAGLGGDSLLPGPSQQFLADGGFAGNTLQHAAWQQAHDAFGAGTPLQPHGSQRLEASALPLNTATAGA